MPDVRESPEEAPLAANAAEDDRYAELLLAGFQACAKEALRFLLEEEGLPPDHPLPAGLNEHLVRQQSHLAGSLQNDSGVDLEESFLTFSTDGDTKPQCDESGASELTDNLHETSPYLIGKETIQMNPCIYESESECRIERLENIES